MQWKDMKRRFCPKMRNYVSLFACMVLLPGYAFPPLEAAELLISPAGYFGTEGTGEGELHNARSVACDLNGNVYVADTGNNRIQKFSGGGAFILARGGFGWGGDQFDNPVGISTSLGLELYIADSYNHRILRYDRDLNYISQFTPENTLEERWKFGFPLDVEISIHGDLFFIDGENKRILRINRLGQPAQGIGGFEDSGNLIEDPEQFAIGPDNRLYVIDRAKSRIVVLDYFGNFVGMFGESDLVNPMGIAVSDLNYIFIADAGLRQTLIFSPEGSLVRRVGPRFIELGREFAEPVDAAYRNGILYVLDRSAGAVFIFKVITE